jgi:hypothetical protein
MRRAFRFLKRAIKAMVGPALSARMAPIYWKARAKLGSRFFPPIRLRRTVRKDFKIGMAVLAHERPEYLELCLASLFQTRLQDYDITFLIQDDGSQDPRVREIIERPRDAKYKIVRSFTPKGHNSWGAAFNKAMRHLMELGDFDIIGSCDADAFFHPDWLDRMMKICLWAKAHHRGHTLGPFSAFNSSNTRFHGILGTFGTPHGNYVVKRRMGALTYFYFRDDLIQLGFFEEHRDDETMMTERFEARRVRNFSTETSYVEHMGRMSVLDQWRQTPVGWHTDHALHLAPDGWPEEVDRVETLGYYEFIKRSVSSRPGVTSSLPLDVIVLFAEKDLEVLPRVVAGVRENLRHPIERILLVGAAQMAQAVSKLCQEQGCVFLDERMVTPLRKEDLPYTVKGEDRSGWLYQQFLKWSCDAIAV